VGGINLIEFNSFDFNSDLQKNNNMKTILFPTDFSKNAAHAARYAGMLAKLYDANLVLLHVHHIPMVPQSNHSFEVRNAISLNEKGAKEDLKVFAKQFIKDSNLPAERIFQRVEYGFPAETIIEIARSVKVDMIVMGTQGASDMMDKWLGTHAQEVMKTAECPVFTIPKNVQIEYPQRILYAADFQGDEVLATEKLLYMAKPLGASCKVVHIHDYFEPNIGHFVEETIKELEERFKKEDVSIQQIQRAEIIEGLEGYMKTYKPDILAMAIHEKSFLSNIFDTSITRHFIQEAKLPMLTFKK
jgi:nucleotide-binding universal stress UspA family protein